MYAYKTGANIFIITYAFRYRHINICGNDAAKLANERQECNVVSCFCSVTNISVRPCRVKY